MAREMISPLRTRRSRAKGEGAEREARRRGGRCGEETSEGGGESRSRNEKETAHQHRFDVANSSTHLPSSEAPSSKEKTKLSGPKKSAKTVQAANQSANIPINRSHQLPCPHYDYQAQRPDPLTRNLPTDRDEQIPLLRLYPLPRLLVPGTP
jgi:hypothetical protein